MEKKEDPHGSFFGDLLFQFTGGHPTNPIAMINITIAKTFFICNPSFITAFNSETESTSGFLYPYLIQFSHLFHVQIILYGVDPLDAPCDLTRFIHGLLRINEAAQLNDPLVSFDTDLE